MICSRCQTENPAEAAFCRNCGAPLAPAPASPIPPAGAESFDPPAPAAAKNPGRWPIAAGLLVLLGLLGYLLGILLRILFLGKLYQIPLSAAFTISTSPVSILSLILTLLTAIASAALFLAPTKRIPVLSSLPQLLTALASPVVFVLEFLRLRRFTLDTAADLVLFFLFFIAALLYFIRTLIRSTSAAMPVIHLVSVILYAFAALASLAVPLLTGNTGILMLIPAVILRLWPLLSLAGHVIASFSLRRKEG